MDAVTHWFRYEDVQYAPPLNEYDEWAGPGRLAVELRTYRVVKVTPCGVRLDTGRFVNAQRHKMFAHPTREAAAEAFKARKRRQASIYEARANRARKAICIIEGPGFSHG